MFGFCGEVLFFIVFVSVLIFLMVVDGVSYGIKFVVCGGEVEEVILVISFVGIKVCVEDFFFNMFVCFKYMKS